MSLASDLAPVHDGHLRLAVLGLLDQMPGYAANDSVLTEAVRALGLGCTRDQMRGHLAWLDEQRLVTRLESAAGLLIATLSERGADVANGRSVVSGVRRPSPRSPG